MQVFLDANGYAKLGDLGFAAVISGLILEGGQISCESQDPPSRFEGKSQTCLGTPQYMAPEVIAGPRLLEVELLLLLHLLGCVICRFGVPGAYPG